MTYVISDLHGCLDKWQAMLEQIKLKETDMLFVLGDVVDRGPSPIPLLLDLMMRPNVFPILGNHECSMLLCVQDLPLDTTLQNLPQRVGKGSLPSLRMWMKNGGRTTLEQYLALPCDEKEQLLNYLQEFTLYESVTVKDATPYRNMTRQQLSALKQKPVLKDRTYLLTHSGLLHFSPERNLEDYQLEEFLSDRPNLDSRYFADQMLVLGHTPTPLIRKDQQPAILFTDTYIDIDCGCSFDGRLGCLRLEDWKEFYVE